MLTLPVVASLGALALYLLAVLRLQVVGRRRWPRRRTGWAVLAGLTVALAVSPLLHTVPSGHRHGASGGPSVLPLDGAVAHMVQHLLLGMYAPLLVVLAAPVSLGLAVAPLRWRPRLRAGLGSRAVAVLTHPVVAAVPAVAGMHVLFLTPLYRLGLEHDRVHHLVQLHLLLAGCLLVLALVGGDPVPPRSGLLLRLGVLVVSAGTHAHLATSVYARAPRLPPGTPHDLAQTQQAALWMYYGGDGAEVLLAVLVCAGWYRRRRRRSGASTPDRPQPDRDLRHRDVVATPASGEPTQPSRCRPAPEAVHQDGGVQPSSTQPGESDGYRRSTTPHASRSLALPVRSVTSRAASPLGV